MTLLRFPCTERKRPLITVGFHSAKSDWNDDRGWPLVGVPTGSVNGFDCLDVDRGGLSWLDKQLLPKTRIHETRSGGRHLLFKHEDGVRCSTGRIAAGVEAGADCEETGEVG